LAASVSLVEEAHPTAPTSTDYWGFFRWRLATSSYSTTRHFTIPVAFELSRMQPCRAAFHESIRSEVEFNRRRSFYRETYHDCSTGRIAGAFSTP